MTYFYRILYHKINLAVKSVPNIMLEECKMNNLEQAAAVKKALDLTKQISGDKFELSRLSLESFRSKPQAPVRETVTAKYPEVRPDVPFWTVELLQALVCWPYIIIYYFTAYKKKKEEAAAKILNSEEYRRQCEAIEEETRQKQAALDDQYNAALKEYNEVTVPEYQRELEKWEKDHTQATEKLQKELEEGQKELAAHYEATRLIPAQYRETDALQYIYDLISSSDYSVREAIEMYDKERQRRLDRQKIYEQQRANRLADEQVQLTYEQNDIADRIRKNERNAAIVGIVQRYNTNKLLKNGFKK